MVNMVKWFFPKGHKPWNKGLTAKTDERVRRGIEKYCRTMKERYPNWVRGHLGKLHSADAKKKMSDAKKGRRLSLETRRKMSLAEKERKTYDARRI